MRSASSEAPHLADDNFWCVEPALTLLGVSRLALPPMRAGETARPPRRASLRQCSLAMDKRRLTSALGRYAVNPVVKTGVRLGLLPGWAVLETTGRRSGEPRRTPVGNGLKGDTFWIVAEHGRRAGYVRNIEADPRVRVLVGRRWRAGTAQLLPQDDPVERQRELGARLNSAFVRLMGTELLTVRVDLEPTD